MYIFGGTNQSDEAQNDIYEINLVHETCQEIRLDGVFPKLSSFAMTLIGDTNN